MFEKFEELFKEKFLVLEIIDYFYKNVSYEDWWNDSYEMIGIEMWGLLVLGFRCRK